MRSVKYRNEKSNPEHYSKLVALNYLSANNGLSMFKKHYWISFSLVYFMQSSLSVGLIADQART